MTGVMDRMVAAGTALVVALGAVPAPAQTNLAKERPVASRTVYTIPPGQEIVQLQTCKSDGCFTAGTLGPFEGGVCVNPEVTPPMITDNAITRNIYIMNRGIQSGPALSIYEKIDVMGALFGTAALRLVKKIPLPQLVGGANVSCSMATNGDYVFAGTDASDQAVRINTATFEVTPLTKFSSHLPVIIAADDTSKDVIVAQHGPHGMSSLYDKRGQVVESGETPFFSANDAERSASILPLLRSGALASLITVDSEGTNGSAANGSRISALVIRPGSYLPPPGITPPNPYVPRPGSAHPHWRLVVPRGGLGGVTPYVAGASGNPVKPAFDVGPYNTPASIACAYHFVAVTAGCNPNIVTANAQGGKGIIAVIEGFDTSKTLASDLKVFSEHFGLPPAKLRIVNYKGVKPPDSITGDPGHSGWNFEASLDTQAAHAMAPEAGVDVIQFNPLIEDAWGAVALAIQLVKQGGGGEVSMSFTADVGPTTNPSEADINELFKAKPGLVFVAAPGDEESYPGYPAGNPYVISVGATATVRVNNVFKYEIPWNDRIAGQSDGGTAAGPYTFEMRPPWQAVLGKVAGDGPYRLVPDIAFVGAPETAMYIVAQGNWYPIGGTSFSAPASAGAINVANQANVGTVTGLRVLTHMYSNFGQGPAKSGFNPVLQGNCGPMALPPYTYIMKGPLCVGVGTPSGYTGFRSDNAHETFQPLAAAGRSRSPSSMKPTPLLSRS